MKSLISRGASLTASPSGGTTLAHVAAVEGQLEILTFLTESIGAPCLVQPDSEVPWGRGGQLLRALGSTRITCPVWSVVSAHNLFAPTVSQGAAPIHWLCSSGGSMRHLSTSTLALSQDRPHTWSHGAPSIRAEIKASDDDDDGDDGGVGGTSSGGSVASSAVSTIDLSGYSMAVVAKVRALRWTLHHEPLLEAVLREGEIQEGGFRCPSHLAAEFEALMAQAPPEAVGGRRGRGGGRGDGGGNGGDDEEEAAEAARAAEELARELLSPAELAALEACEAAERRLAGARARLANLRDAQQETPLLWACSFEVCPRSPATFSPATFGPATFSPATFSPATFGPATFGPATFSPATFGPATFGPATFSPTLSPLLLGRWTAARPRTRPGRRSGCPWPSSWSPSGLTSTPSRRRALPRCTPRRGPGPSCSLSECTFERPGKPLAAHAYTLPSSHTHCSCAFCSWSSSGAARYLVYEAGASAAVRDGKGVNALGYARLYSRDKATIDVLRKATPV